MSGSEEMQTPKSEERKTPKYECPEYWENFYQNNSEEMEWLAHYVEIANIIRGAVKNRKDSKILHVGCGNSKVPEAMYDEGFRNIVNIDVAPAVVTTMIERNYRRPVMCWLWMDATNMDFLDSSFDMVLDKSLIDVFNCFEDQEEANAQVEGYLKEVARVLRDGAVFVCGTFSMARTRFEPCVQKAGLTVQMSLILRGQKGIFVHVCCKDSSSISEEEGAELQVSSFTDANRPRYYITGSWDDWKVTEMRWDGERQRYFFRVRLGRESWESFQILLDRDFKKCVHPDCMDACPHEKYGLCGPDDKGHGLNWTIGRHSLDKASPGACYEVRLTLSKGGQVLVVDWEALHRKDAGNSPDPSSLMVSENSNPSGNSIRPKTPAPSCSWKPKAVAAATQDLKCPAGHKLDDLIAVEPRSCNECGEAILVGKLMMGCRRCNYDVCSDCQEYLQEAFSASPRLAAFQCLDAEGYGAEVWGPINATVGEIFERALAILGRPRPPGKAGMSFHGLHVDFHHRRSRLQMDDSVPAEYFMARPRGIDRCNEAEEPPVARLVTSNYSFQQARNRAIETRIQRVRSLLEDLKQEFESDEYQQKLSAITTKEQQQRLTQRSQLKVMGQHGFPVGLTSNTRKQELTWMMKSFNQSAVFVPEIQDLVNQVFVCSGWWSKRDTLAHDHSGPVTRDEWRGS
mmetsp:Transcript_78489/g.139176  ORF Transcript_78489/g.139176 Transcript_78489/m.139176 type:complete len:684 (-) Transcript_78489:114-2165(-)